MRRLLLISLIAMALSSAVLACLGQAARETGPSRYATERTFAGLALGDKVVASIESAAVVTLFASSMTALAAAVIAIHKRSTRPRRFPAGRCLDCGYDPRASPVRCPECGRSR